MKKRTVIFDVDDTLLDYVGTWLQRYRNESGHELYPRDIRKPDVPSFAKEMPMDWHVATMRDPGLFYEMPALPGALDVVRLFRETGFQVLFATETTPNTYAEKFGRLYELGFTDNYNEFITISRQHKPRLKCTALFDDIPSTIERTLNGVLYNQPWNYSRPDLPRTDWLQPIALVESVSRLSELLE